MSIGSDDRSSDAKETTMKKILTLTTAALIGLSVVGAAPALASNGPASASASKDSTVRVVSSYQVIALKACKYC